MNLRSDGYNLESISKKNVELESGRSLSGLKVLNLGLSGAILFTTKYLADFGATVVLVESKTHVDITRSSAPFWGGITSPNRSATATNTITSTYSMGVNLRNPKGAEVVKRLVAWADVVAASFAPGVLQRLGLGRHDLERLNPRLIIAMLSLLGQTGPHSSMTGFGWTSKALSSLNEYCGWPDRQGTGIPGAYPDFTTPMLLTAAILAALLYREKTGKGQFIDCSQLESTLYFTPSHFFLDYFANGRVSGRLGNRDPAAVPHGAYPCKGDDKWCVISVRNDKEWQAFGRVLCSVPWIGEVRFSDFIGRKKHEDELDSLIAEWTIGFTQKEIMDKMQAAGVQAGMVQGYDTLLDEDPQLQYRGTFQTLSRPEMENVRHVGWPGKFLKTPYVLRPTPTLGQHTEWVCREILHMEDDEFVQLLDEGALEAGE